MGTLTVARAKSLYEPGLYRADPTLYLRIAAGGSKSWIQRLTIEGRRHDLGLGSFPLVTLAEARDQAHKNRRLARAGGDPLAAKRRAKTPTFRQAASRTCDALRPRWRNRKHAKDWMATLERHAFPVLADMSVDRIRREDVLRVLTPIWTRRPETARRVRQRMRAVLRWCWAHMSGRTPTLRHSSVSPAESAKSAGCVHSVRSSPSASPNSTGSRLSPRASANAASQRSRVSRNAGSDA
jgi:hypothetical protein